jgi:glycosyltransferase involved in cell wall biosynthesis
MPKIALIVEPEFLQHHWGVRVYLYSLSKVLARHEWQVDFVFPRQSSAFDLRWYKAHVRDASLFSSAGPSAAGAPMDVFNALREAAFRPHAPAAPAQVPPGLQRPEVMPIGSSASLANEKYDALIVTNPWMVRWRERLPAPKVCGVVLDLIPNLFGMLLDEGKPFMFAHQHEFGFRYFEDYCDRVLTISPATRDAYLDLIRARRPSLAGPDVMALPAMPPYHALDETPRPCPATRVKRLVLASCLDPRKGLKEIPAMINALAGDVDEVLMYGAVRCHPRDVEAFFQQLQVPRFVWHLGPTASEVREIFRTSRLLLFPSRFEGLGLPLLEAQLQGCRVATYPISPMQELGLSGAVTLSDDPGESVARMRAALQETFDHAALRDEARAAFVQPVLDTNPLAPILH